MVVAEIPSFTLFITGKIWYDYKIVEIYKTQAAAENTIYGGFKMLELKNISFQVTD